MSLTLQVISYKGQPPPEQLEGSFDQYGGTIGRFPENRKNHLTLPDPDKFISRKHALIKYENGSYYLTDTSLDGTYILNRNQRVHRSTVQLCDGDQLKIGDYDLIVRISSRGKFEQTPPTSPDLAEGASFLFGLNPKKGRQVETAEARPGLETGDFLWPQSEASEQSPKQNRTGGYMEESPAHDFFSPPDVAADPDQTQEIPKNFNFEDLLNGLGQNSGTSPLHHSRDAADPAPAHQGIPAHAITEPRLDGRPDDDHPKRQNRAAPAGEQSRENATFAVAEAARDIRQQAHVELFKVFLEAAGVNDTSFLRQEDIPKLMQTVGVVFRELVDGLMAILRGRSELKNQFRVAATILRPADNNPLKFAKVVDDALIQFLAKKQPGFVDAIEAVRESYADIMNHQLAMTAGIQAAIINLLDRFDPQHFARPYEEGVIFQKKTKAWDAYRQAYAKIANEALEDFFGESFARAYEAQIRKLRSTNRPK